MNDAKPAAVITGGSTGIGLAIVEQLLASGYTVVNLARRAVPLDSPDCVDYEVDLLDRAALDAVCAELGRHRPAAFIHNAGAIRPNLLSDVKLSDLDALNQLHLGAAIRIVQAILPAMQAAACGRIVLISSRASVGMATRTAYSATKAAQIAMARTWALEFAAAGITVNTVSPGPIEATEMFHELVPKGGELAAAMAAKIPVGRLGLPRDVARAVMFFLAADAGFVTGQNLFVCGGTSIGSA